MLKKFLVSMWIREKVISSSSVSYISPSSGGLGKEAMKKIHSAYPVCKSAQVIFCDFSEQVAE